MLSKLTYIEIGMLVIQSSMRLRFATAMTSDSVRLLSLNLLSTC